jgi:uncharacterized protein (TIGR02001 family)
MRTTTAVLAALVGLTLTTPAPCQQQGTPYTLTGNVTVASEYISRGIGLSNRKPAIQGGLDYVHHSGLYVGTWASSTTILSDQGASSSLEWDLYAGYKRTAGDLGFDAGVLYFYYPGNYPAHWVSCNTAELYLGGSWKMLSLKYSYAVTNQFGWQTPEGGDTNGSWYLDVTGSLPVGSGVTITAHVGHQEIRGFADASYTDWKLGASRDFAGLSLGLVYVGTNARGDPGEPYRNRFGKDLGAGRLLATVGKSL